MHSRGVLGPAPPNGLHMSTIPSKTTVPNRKKKGAIPQSLAVYSGFNFLIVSPSSNESTRILSCGSPGGVLPFSHVCYNPLEKANLPPNDFFSNFSQ
jgi:hypothetical protein